MSEVAHAERTVMIGWRGKLGFVLPSNNTVLEPEAYSILPPGYSAHFSRIVSTGMAVDELGGF